MAEVHTARLSCHLSLFDDQPQTVGLRFANTVRNRYSQVSMASSSAASSMGARSGDREDKNTGMQLVGDSTGS